MKGFEAKTASLILATDLDAVHLENIKSAFGASCEVDTASFIDYDSCITKIEEGLPIVTIITDKKTKENCLSFLEKIKKEKSYLSIIFISDNLAHRKHIYPSNTNEFLLEPFSDFELISLVNKVVRVRTQISMLDMAKEKLEKEKIKLSRYFSEDVISMILKKDEMDSINSDHVKGTILFLDIRNFSTYSEDLEPSEVAKFLNLLLTDFMDIIFSHGGSVNKLIGDAILATFGCPHESPDDALNAVKTSLALMETLEVFNAARPGFLEREIKVGIGIATGIVFAGNIGSYRRMEYTVIGDVVNLAARLQELTKKIKEGSIMIDENTYEKTKKFIRVKHISLNQIRGKMNPVKLYLLTGFKKDSKGSIPENTKSFANWKL